LAVSWLAIVQTVCSQTWCPLDPTFSPRLNNASAVYFVTLQPNGQILIGGAFLSINGTAITNVARLNQDGTLDATFNPSGAAAFGSVDAIAVQNNGKIVIGGAFASIAGVAPQNLARLNANGSVDPTFDPNLFVDGPVNAVVMQPDGRILLGGSFNTIDNVDRVSLARLNTNGTLDMSFDACVSASAGDGATALSVLGNGQILASGNFSFRTNTVFRNGIARLDPCGDVDLTYAPQPGIDSGASYIFALRSNGKVILGGDFKFYGFDNRSGVTQLSASGTVDTNFDPGTGIDQGNTVYAMALQSDGKVVIGGDVTSYNEQPHSGLARLNLDGTLDLNCDPGLGPNNSISSMVIQPDGRILVAGKFTSFDGQPRSGLARLGGARLGPISQLENGQFQMLFYGNDQAHYSLQASSDGKHWTNSILTNVIGATKPVPLIDPTTDFLPQRFYRTIVAP